MKQIIDAWQKQQEWQRIKRQLNTDNNLAIIGLPHMLRASLAAAIFKESHQSMVIITKEESEAMMLAEDLSSYMADQVYHFPVLELLPFEVYAHNIELISARVKTLSALLQKEKILVVTCINALNRRLIPPESFLSTHINLKTNQTIEVEELASKLADIGYERSSLTEIPGCFSARGSIIDIFAISQDHPYRIEFFDDQIESIKQFDPISQLSKQGIETIVIPPAHELPIEDSARSRALSLLDKTLDEQKAKLNSEAKYNLEQNFAPLLNYLQQGIWDNSLENMLSFFYQQPFSLLDYFDKGNILLFEAEAIKQESLDLANERDSRYFDLIEQGKMLPPFFDNFITYQDIATHFSRKKTFIFNQLLLQSADIDIKEEFHFSAKDLPNYANNPNSFNKDINSFINDGYQVIISASSAVRLQRARDIIEEMGFFGITFVEAGWSQGFVSPLLKMALITEKELFDKQKRKKPRHMFKGGEKISSFLDLHPGDYVVHIYQGIGQYIGVEQLKIGDISRDYLLIKYRGEDKLYLPVDQLDLIQKYIGNEGKAPRLNRMGGSEWNRTKANVRQAVKEMAEQLLKLYAQRELSIGYSFSPDFPWQRDFEDAFTYIETDDQLKSVEEIKEDMQSVKAMDRLLCGDVGYGKTEVALRAAFKAIMDNKQVAILVPTTVLAEQHFHTIEDRFSNFPIRFASLSRFSSPKQQKQVIDKLAAGEIDLVVGTHRLLSKDVRFKDLGLLIIDEEQRFGVAHKEKIKELKTKVDVLTLSATPIPRTLHMALVGMRDMSIITTPPEDRHPVQTYVVEFNEKLIRDAIARELGRQGQVFFVHNRVADIFEAADRIRSILPEARIAVAHGQMKEKELEKAMLDFVGKKADVLVCTTIIESGLDIPNVNTLIVDDADTFGLAQLYQLRGRVGRSQRQAFAYFTFKKDRLISDIAKKRLITIRDFTELGSGFKIAMRDLELRGAGNILGPEQHGHIMAVGFDLYCKLLEEETRKAAGESEPIDKISTLLEFDINAYIPDKYIDDSVLKVEIYQRLAEAKDEESVNSLAGEMEDRYGELPSTVKNLCLLSKTKVLGKKLMIESIIQKPLKIEIKFAEQHRISGESLLSLINKWPDRLKFSNKKAFMINLIADPKLDTLQQISLLNQILNDLVQIINKEA